MLKEPVKIILRRFRDRSLESGLLVLAVSLGIGVFSSGISLLMQTASFSKELMKSPLYRELIVSSHSNAGEMETPVSEKPVRETAVLTQSDLKAAEITPNIKYAYIQSRNKLHLISSDSVNITGRPAYMMPPPEPSNPGNETGERQAQEHPAPPPEMISEEEIKAAEKDNTILMLDMDSIFGYSVTPQFFDSWDVSSSEGSLFTASDLNKTDNIIILGSGLAEIIAGNEFEQSELLGKKLLCREGYQTIIGILKPFSEDYDGFFFSPYRNQLAAGFSGIRRRSMDAELRFAVEDPARLDETASLLSIWFAKNYGDNQILISNPRSQAEQLIERNKGIGMLILFLSSAGFFIALVNISNILMSRVIRMKKNIGVLMALGSSKNGITRLFITESLILALSGAVFGIVLAVPLGSSMSKAADMGSGSWIYTAAGVLVSTALTILFGVIPSRKYMKLDPAQAMRTGA